ncbi:MAG: transcriptional repressor [Clostridiales bacterium]|nr:transcriptional repressor [Clostridiales bacterium]
MSYMTLQRKALIDVLEQHRDEPLSADRIITLIGENASRSAVYRNLSALEKQGLIKKTAASGSNKTLYRYVGSDECRDHLHLECSACGKTYHLKVPATNALINDVMQDANFQIDSSSTVLYGICEKCRKS